MNSIGKKNIIGIEFDSNCDDGLGPFLSIEDIAYMNVFGVTDNYSYVDNGIVIEKNFVSLHVGIKTKNLPEYVIKELSTCKGYMFISVRYEDKTVDRFNLFYTTEDGIKMKSPFIDNSCDNEIHILYK